MIFVLAISGILAFWWVLNSTRTGMAVRAVAQNPVGAEDRRHSQEPHLRRHLRPVHGDGRPRRHLLAEMPSFRPWAAGTSLVKSWVITAFGGMGSIRGGLLAAFILGMLEAFVGYWFGTLTWVLFALFGVLLVTLAIRPRG